MKDIKKMTVAEIKEEAKKMEEQEQEQELGRLKAKQEQQQEEQFKKLDADLKKLKDLLKDGKGQDQLIAGIGQIQKDLYSMKTDVINLRSILGTAMKTIEETRDFISEMLPTVNSGVLLVMAHLSDGKGVARMQDVDDKQIQKAAKIITEFHERQAKQHQEKQDELIKETLEQNIKAAKEADGQENNS